MKWSIALLVVLGLVAAFSASLLVTALGNEARAARAGDRANAEVKVLVAARDLAAVTVVSADAIEQRTIPAKDAPAGGLADPVQAVGKVLGRPVVAGQPLTASCFITSAGMNVVSALKEGKRAVTVELPYSAGLEGLLYPGAVVDVLATFKLRTDGGVDGNAVSTTLIEAVEVLAIDDRTVIPESEKTADAAKEKAKGGGLVHGKTRRVTLLVDTKQAEALALATEHGAVSLTMRNPLDEATVDGDATLLSGGRLANLAEFLESSVRADRRGEPVQREPADPIEPAVPVASPAPPIVTQTAPVRANDKRWQVTVYRGLKSESVEFSLEKRD